MRKVICRQIMHLSFEKPSGKETASRIDLRKVVHDPLVSENGTKCNHGLPKQQMPKSAYQNKTISTLVSNAFSALKEDNGKPMVDLVGDTRNKVGDPQRKTGIWSGRKADSPKRHVAFSVETKLRYFDNLMTWDKWARKWSMGMLLVRMVGGFLWLLALILVLPGLRCRISPTSFVLQCFLA
ncbi:hypothetical protein Tco_1015282 [Tanacetum coccineum]|uniref:Uncharacterized protein n=1 Tax=Tanacetum coccineum TaxID=301880 RepID=A0ABQ5FMT7_9ASTR